jgi:GT2 family glycosyltransferase
VAFACFRRSVWHDLGGFNERLLANEDYDFNYRVRQSGRKVILDRREYCDYFARPTLGALAAQYRRYGSWKAEMVRLSPRSLRLRHLAAPLFILSLVFLGAAGTVWRPAWWILLVEIAVYLLAGLAAGAQAMMRTKSSPLMVVLMPVVFATIQITWGISFLTRLSGLRGLR